MFHYRAFELNIRSEFALEGLPEIDAAVDGEWVELLNRTIPNHGRDGESEVTGTAEGLLRCHVSNGRRIIVDLMPEADVELVKSMLVGELMAALLRQRGYLVLHGAAVASGGEAIGFIGNSGWGKSTLATFFTHRDYSFLTDDVLAIDLSTDEALVVPGPAHSKLSEDVGRMFVDDFRALKRVHSRTPKRLALQPEPMLRTSVPLRKLYFLEGIPRSKTSITELRGKDAFIELLRHSRAQKLFKAPRYQARQMEQCKRLLDRVPVAVLQRPRSLDLLSHVAETVERNLQSILSSSV